MIALYLAALAWWLLLLSRLPRDRDSAAVGLWAAVIVAATWSPRVQKHVGRELDAALQVSMWGATWSEQYGGGWKAIGVLSAPWPAWVGTAHLLPAALVVLMSMWARVWVLEETDDRGSAIAAACTLPLVPQVLEFSAVPSPFVAAMVLPVVALAALARGSARDEWLAGLSIGLLAHVRPLQVAVALALLGIGWRRGRRVACGVGALLVGARLLSWAVHRPEGHESQLAMLDVGRLASSFASAEPPVLWLDVNHTPAGFVALAVLGAALGRTWTGGAVALVVLNTAVYVFQPALADRLRFQLPSQALLGVLAGVGALWLWRRSPNLGIVLGALVFSSWWVARPFARPFAWQTEHQVWVEALERVPDGATVTWERGAYSQELPVWLERHGRGRWVEGPPRDDAWLWVGLASQTTAHPPLDLSGRERVVGGPVPSRWGGLPHYGPWDDRPKQVGLYTPRE